MESPVLISLFMLTAIFVQATQCQTLNGPSSVVMEAGTNTQLRCSVTGGSTSIFTWIDVSGGQSVTMFSGGNPVISNPKYANFGVSDDVTSSTLTITDTQIADEGSYVCQSNEVQNPAPAAEVTVEVEPDTSIQSNSTATAGESFQVTCTAVGSRPAVDFNWFLGNVQQTDGIETTYDTNSGNAELTDTTSTFTFIPAKEDNGQSLRCETTGHQLTNLDQQESISSLNVHFPPDANIITVDFNEDTATTMLTVTCSILQSDQPNPFVTMYYIYENVTDNPSPVSSSVSFTRVTPDFETEYLCVGGNYLGNTTATKAFVPGSTTTLPPTTGPAMTSGEPEGPGGGSNIAAIVGGIIGALAVIGIIVGLCCCFSRCPESLPSSCLYCCPASCEPICPSACITLATSKTSVSHSTSKVSNGKESEPQKMQLQSVAPTAAPRSSTGPPGQVKHTINSTTGDEYAVVEKGNMQGSGDSDHVDYGVGGQGDPQLQYAELDMSNRAGHTDQRIPQKPNDVVVYSSILV